MDLLTSDGDYFFPCPTTFQLKIHNLGWLPSYRCEDLMGVSILDLICVQHIRNPSADQTRDFEFGSKASKVRQ
jgi:hypothetical protein